VHQCALVSLSGYFTFWAYLSGVFWLVTDTSVNLYFSVVARSYWFHLQVSNAYHHQRLEAPPLYIAVHQQTPRASQMEQSQIFRRQGPLSCTLDTKELVAESNIPSVQDDKMIALGQSVLGESVVGSGLTALEEEALGGGGGDVYVRMDDSRVDGSSE
jgi:hypothetical protein